MVSNIYIYTYIYTLLDPVSVLTKNIAVNKTLSGRTVNQIEKPKTVAYQQKGFSPIVSKVTK